MFVSETYEPSIFSQKFPERSEGVMVVTDCWLWAFITPYCLSEYWHVAKIATDVSIALPNAVLKGMTEELFLEGCGWV